MKNIAKFSIFITAFLLAIYSGAAISAATGWNPFAVFSVVMLTAFITTPENVLLMAYSLANIVKPTGADNNGGTKKYFYLSDVTEITTLQPVMTYSAPGDEVRITASHVWATGKAAAKVFISENTGEITEETTGNIDGRGKKFMFKAFHPGISTIFGEAERNWKRIDAILHIPMANGKMIQLGQAGEECEIFARFKSNTRGGDGAGWEIEASCYSNLLLQYEGTIDNTF